MATEWSTASSHGTVTGVDAGCQILLVVFSNGGTLRGILVPMQSKSVASAAGPKNLGFVAKGMGCWMFLGKAKAALARKQKMYNAKVAFFVHIVDGGWRCVRAVARICCGLQQ